MANGIINPLWPAIRVLVTAQDDPRIRHGALNRQRGKARVRLKPRPCTSHPTRFNPIGVLRLGDSDFPNMAPA